MARAITTSRNSRTADRQGPANQSPFRSCNPSKRYIAAMEMIAKRHEEMERLQAALAKATTAKQQRSLATRLLATKNNLKSWEAYVSGANERDEEYYREPRAVIISRPTTKRK